MAGPVDYAALLDFSRPFSVPLLDATVNTFYTSGNTEEARSQQKSCQPACRGRWPTLQRRDAPLACPPLKARASAVSSRTDGGCRFGALARAALTPLRAAHGGGAGDETAAGAPGHVAACRCHPGDKYLFQLEVLRASGAPRPGSRQARVLAWSADVRRRAQWRAKRGEQRGAPQRFPSFCQHRSLPGACLASAREPAARLARGVCRRGRSSAAAVQTVFFLRREHSRGSRACRFVRRCWRA